ncbi:MAG: hypothetical protein WD490_00180 [Opitutales bacterium]
MIPNFLFLLLALALLFLPVTLFYSTSVQRVLSRQYRSDEFKLKEFFLAWQNGLDLIRGFAGTYILVNWVLPLEPVADEKVTSGHIWAAAILTVAVLIQTVRFRRRLYLLAPVFFLWGITVALSPAPPAFYAIALGLITVVMSNNIELNFPVMTVVLGVSGFFLSGADVLVAINCALILLPYLIMLGSKRSMAFFMRTIPR